MEQSKFGKKLIEIRKANGLTQGELAEKSKITSRTIQRIESGIVKPRTFTIKILSDILGYDFFETLKFTGDEVENENQHSNLKSHTLSWYLKDLFNLKTNAMKKLSILTASFIIGLALFVLISETKAQSQNEKSNNSITIQYNNDKSIKRIEVRFSNSLTFDSLVNIQSDLKARGIKINYKKTVFDEKDQLLEIDCAIDCNDGYKGSFAIALLNSTNKNEMRGFFRDYTKNAEIPFCTGGCGL